MQKTGATGDGKSAVATPDGKKPKEEEEEEEGIDKGRRNETTIAQNILTRLQGMSTSILRKPTSMLQICTRSNIFRAYPSIKQSRDD